MIDRTSDLHVLAATTWGEARGDGEADEHGVCSVVMNRVAVAKAWLARHGKEHPLFGSGSIAECCLMRGQFDCWNNSDPNELKIEGLDFASPSTSLVGCIALAAAAIAGHLPDNTNGALYYKRTDLPWPHSWGPEQKTALAVLGKQSFYRL